MPRAKPSMLLAAGGVIAIAVWARGQVAPPGTLMVESADRFLAALDETQAKTARFDFDDAERLNWHFIPRLRKGLPLKSMTPAQQSLAFGLIQSGLGGAGFLKATTIMSLESILQEMEKGSGPVRDPELYYVAIFGRPAPTGTWGWRVEGHHLSLNFVIKDGSVVAATPAFFGSNPGEVRQGPRKGLRTLADLEDRALRLLQALDADQAKRAIVLETAPGEIRNPNTPQPPVSDPEGIAYGDLNDDQKAMMRSLVEAYAGDMTPEVAHAWLDEIRQAGPEKVRFAWMGSRERTLAHAYKIQGPTFLIEFNNTQNNANHVHSIWRNLMGDFNVPVAK